MDRSYFIHPISCRLKQPLLIWISCFIPLNDFATNISTFSSNIETQSIQNTLNEVSFIMFHPSPSLIELSVDLVLNNSLSGLKDRTGNIQSFSRQAINDQTALIDGIIYLYFFKSPKMIFRIGIEESKLGESFKINTLIAFLARFYPIVAIKRSNASFSDSKQLRRFLFTKLQDNLLPIFSQYQPSFEIDDLIVIDFFSCFYDVKQLEIILRIVRHSYQS